MIPYCKEEHIALTPYSALAGGRLAKRPGETSKRQREDSYAKFKYDAAQKIDMPVLDRVARLATQKGVPMAEIALAWLLRKADAPVAGATSLSHVECAVNATALNLSPEECAWLEEPYVPHPLVGVMAENTPPAHEAGICR